MLFFVSRARRSGRHLEWKIRLFSVAAVLGLGGIGLELRWLTWIAIGLLAVGMGLRLAPGGDEAEAAEGEDEAEGPEGEEGAENDEGGDEGPGEGEDTEEEGDGEGPRPDRG
ncbi:MAG TPA: hypothetical protein VFQ22_01025 [Longimicrobiales bacterium]|nr:hypothetical protein [Longimicrobiales bacterium]